MVERHELVQTWASTTLVPKTPIETVQLLVLVTHEVVIDVHFITSRTTINLNLNDCLPL